MSLATCTQDPSHEPVTMGGPPFAFPKSLWKGAGAVALTALAYLAGSSGWITIGPGDRLASLEGSDARQSIDQQATTAQLTQVKAGLEFVTELLCQPVLSDSAGRSPGDRYLRQRCLIFTERPTSMTRVAAGGG